MVHVKKWVIVIEWAWKFQWKWMKGEGMIDEGIPKRFLSIFFDPKMTYAPQIIPFTGTLSTYVPPTTPSYDVYHT